MTNCDNLTMSSRLKMNDGNTIPILGFGVFQMNDGAQCEKAVRDALDAGYRHLDTAWIYKNEEFVGNALAASGVDRGDVFLTTKTHFDLSPAKIKEAFGLSLTKLRTDYIDLLLIHWPFADAAFGPAWATLEELKAKGQCRSIGVSNITLRRFKEAFFKYVSAVPAVNQMEIHVYNQQTELVGYCREKGMLMQAYSPLSRGKRLGDPDPKLVKVAGEVGRTVPQVMLRWVLQKGIVALPKSVTTSRIQENARLFDFSLSAGQMATLDSLNKNEVIQDWRPDGYY